MKHVFVSLCLLLFSFITYGQEKEGWIYVGRAIDSTLYYVKKEVASYNKIWTMTILPNWSYKKISYKNVTVKELVQFDCGDKKIRSYQMVFYSSKGNLIINEQYEQFETKWENSIPDTMGEMVLNKICELFGK